MTGSGKARKGDQAVAALLEQPTIAAATSAVGIGEKTLRRWLAEPTFQADYRAAREQAVRMAVGRLQGLLSTAIETLQRAMTCGTPTVEVRAAIAVIALVSGRLTSSPF